MDKALTPPEIPTDLGDGMRTLRPLSRPMGRATAIDRRSLCQTAEAAEAVPRRHASWRLWAWMSVTTGDPLTVS